MKKNENVKKEIKETTSLKKTGNNTTELVFILDRSGSMGGLESDTIGGFNGMITKQKKEEGNVIVSTVLFSDGSTVLHNRVDIKEIKPMTDADYYVGGCTALLDAVGGAVDHIRSLREEMDKKDIPEKTIFIITTDGLENASHTYTYDIVKKMISDQQEKHNWEFMFLGANIDAVSEAAKYGIKANRAATYTSDSRGTALNFEVLSKTVGKMRACKSARAMNCMMDESDCLMEIREDNKHR